MKKNKLKIHCLLQEEKIKFTSKKNLHRAAHGLHNMASARWSATAANRNHFWHRIRNFGRIAQPAHKSRSTTMEYHIPRISFQRQDIPTCSKFHIANWSIAPSGFLRTGERRESYSCRKVHRSITLCFSEHNVVSASTKAPWLSTIVMCVRSHSSSHLVPFN